jgi:hypothetical protein
MSPGFTQEAGQHRGGAQVHKWDRGIMSLTALTAGRRYALGAAVLVACLSLAACGGSSHPHSTTRLVVQKQVTCVTAAGHHVQVAERADGTPQRPVPDRRTGQPLACKASHPTPRKALGSAPDVAACLPQVTTNRPDESVCLFWYNETTLPLTLQTASCGDGHISPGTYDSYPGESYSALPTNTFLTQDFDPSAGEGGNTRVQCTIVWNNQGGGPAFQASFNYDEFSTPTTLAVTATASPGYATPLSAFVVPGNNNMASIVLCDATDPLCSGNYKCPNGSGWMSCEFGPNPSSTDQSSPILSDVSMPGSHDAGTYSLISEPVLDVCASGGNQWEDLAPGVVAAWAQTQANDTYEQASAGSRYFDVRGIDAAPTVAGHLLYSGVRHCPHRALPAGRTSSASSSILRWTGPRTVLSNSARSIPARS